MSSAPKNAKQIFLDAIEQHAPDQWPAFLERAAGDDPQLRRRVEILLEAHVAEKSLLDNPAIAGPAVEAAATLDHSRERPGTVIGPYKLLQQIGEGGMGTVFMAEQTHPVRRKVALKVIKPGMDSRQIIARFEAERQALAMMDHVNIARVFDGGTTGESRSQNSEFGSEKSHDRNLLDSDSWIPNSSGRPYFVMELVHGVPITKYCDDNHLTPRERLELFVPVCHAIQHAHQKGIIHRDIKPSNVMVTLYDGKPVPKVIDFGVAKATEQKLTERTLFTQYGTMVGTPQYMSPEQAEMSALGVDTRSDIYSLGVLLYELLTGSTPLTHKRMKEAAYGEILRMIKEEEPPKPSTRLSDSGEALASISANRHMEPSKLTKLVRGELDWIVMKTLEKDRNRRYETANGFAMDVQRYLADEPVQACPPSAWYRLRKFARRNKGAFCTAGFVALALVLGTIVSSLQALRATRAENLAQKRLGETGQALSQAQQKTRLARQVVQEMYTRFAEKWLADEPQLTEVQREFLVKAQGFYEQLAQEQGSDPEVLHEKATAYANVADIERALGNHEPAERAYRQANAILEPLIAEFPERRQYQENRAANLNNLGNSLKHCGRPLEAEGAFREAILIDERWLVDHATDLPRRRALGAVQHNQAALLNNRGELREACRLFVEAQDHQQAFLKANPKDPIAREYLGNHTGALGFVWALFGEPAKADQASREARDVRQELVRDFPRAPKYRALLAQSHMLMGQRLRASGDLAEAEQEFRAADSLLARLAEDFPKLPEYRADQGTSQTALAGVLTQMGRLLEAEQTLQGTIALLREITQRNPEVPQYWQSLAASHNELGRGMNRGGQPQKAVAAYREAIAVYNERLERPGITPGEQHNLALWHINLGTALDDSGQPLQAAQAYRQALSVMEKLVNHYPQRFDYQQDLALARHNLGTAHYGMGKHFEAEQALRQSILLCTKLADQFPAMPEYRHELARSHDALAQTVKTFEEGEKNARRAIALYQQLLAEGNNLDYRAGLASSLLHRAELFWTSGQLLQVEEPLREALSHYEKLAAEFPGVVKYRRTLVEGYAKLGALLRTLGRVSDAEVAIRKGLADLIHLVAESPQNVQLKRSLGITYFELGRVLHETRHIAEAEEAYLKAAAIFRDLAASLPEARGDSDNLTITLNNLGVLLEETARIEPAVKVFQEVIATQKQVLSAAPNDVTAVQRLAMIYNNLGVLLANARQHEPAEEAHREALRLYVQWARLDAGSVAPLQYLPHCTNSLGIVLWSAGRLEEAKQVFREAEQGYRKCLNLAPNHPSPANLLARFLVLCPDAEFRNAAEAVLLAKRATAQLPDNADCQQTLGLAYYRAGEWRAAIETLQKANQLQLGAIPRFFQAMAHWKLGEEEEAHKQYKQAVEWMEKNQPRNEELRRIRAETAALLMIDEQATTKPE